MRSAEEILELIIDFANEDARVRILGMEGSRVNTNISKGEFQDFDITYFVNDIDEFTKNDDWLSYF